MNSDLRAQLLQMGFSLSQARAAVAAGKQTSEEATEWIFNHNSTISEQPSSTPGGSVVGQRLRLRTEDEDLDADLQKALAASAMEITSPAASKPPPVQDTSIAEDENAPKKIKINIVKARPSTVPAPLPLTSRHKDSAQDAQHAAHLAEVSKRAEKLKREKMETRLAHERARVALKEDRENRKLRNQAAVTSPTPGATSGSVAPSPVAAISTAQTPTLAATPKLTQVQMRLKDGSVWKQSLQSTATLKDLFDVARSQDRHIGAADFSLIQAFPRREFTTVEGHLTLVEAGLCPSCSLNVFIQAPIPAPQPITPIQPTPGAWLSSDVEMEEPPSEGGNQNQVGHQDDEDEDEGSDDIAVDESGNADNSDESEEDNEEDGVHNEEEGEDDEDDDMMHALPVQFNPAQGHQGHFAGRGRGRGRGGMAFSGAGHSLSSGSAALNPSVAQPPVPENLTPAEIEARRRQRVLEAMEQRSRSQASEAAKAQELHPKRLKERVVPSLKSICSYQVAVMLTANDTLSSRRLRLLSDDVGSQVTESIIQELIKLKQLDQLTFRRLYRCSVVNISLDGYSRATDSLMECIGSSQARSLTNLSLKGCQFLTDAGFYSIATLLELESLDLSHCRVTDKTLEFLQNLPILSTLLLSATKITSKGLAAIISKSAWRNNLHTLDVSYCEGISGSAVLVTVQELVNIQSLSLNNTLAFNQGTVLVPDSLAFTRLTSLDLARTPISSQDLISLTSSFKSLQTLGLTECPNIQPDALERCAQDLRALRHLQFPNREFDLLTVLPLAAVLPLTHLDLTGFVHVQDEAILALASATSLQMLSLAGTKLTDVGSAVFARMTSLKELCLDRTNIGDKSMEYLRDLGRIEVLSLNQCQRLTTTGITTLGKSAFFSLRLKRLNLGRNKYIHDDALPAFQHCKVLNTLNLEYTDVREEKALQLQYILPNLSQLRVQGVTNGEVYEANPRPTFT